ncbi:NIN-like protein [Artemisia annua]|uniref:NIN-like protein n=1 Tax=Artemisia annua TaxID=35608 RepID=A0A2U1N2V0_ARTAN|nr:NIN-like protein [Artemisia annua]
MNSFRRSQSADSAEREKSSCSGPLSVLFKDQITELWHKTSLQKPTIPFSDESRYLIPLWVSANEDPREELYQSVSSQSIITCIEPKDELFVPVHQKIEQKIRAALKLLTFREEHVLIQFWSPRVVGKHQLLTTADQPFGVGVIEVGLLFYRKNSEQNVYLVDKDDEEEDISPPARVFRRGLPEWTSDLTNYRPKDFLQQECAICCNLHGYLALPVFDSTTGLCVGVIELLMSSTNTTNAFEVQQVHKALKASLTNPHFFVENLSSLQTVNLTSPQVYDIAIPKVLNEWRQNELDKILSILKSMCDIHNLPLAQTWVVSASTTFVSHDEIIEKSCSSFDTRCIGKVCLSTNALPFYVRDLRVWPFREACKEQHLDKSRSFVAKALLTRGSCYCQDVTQLSEEEYPLVHNARMSGLKSCFTIFLHSNEGNDDYVFEFYLPSNIEDGSYLVQTLKQNIVVASGFELGNISPIQFIGPPQSIQISSITTANTTAYGMNSSDSNSVFANVVKIDNKQGDISNNYNLVASKTNDSGASHPIVNKKKTRDTIVKRRRKRKIDSLTMEAVEQHVGKPIDEAAKSFGVSRSTLKRFCRVNGLSSWPKPKQSKKTTNLTNSKPSQELSSIQRFQQSSKPCKHIGGVVLVVIRVKRWSCSSKRHGFSGKWWICGQHIYIPYEPDSKYIYQAAQQMIVKATFKDDMIKFRFPISSGRLLELENQVAQRLDLKGKKLIVKYKDKENEPVLITRDSDLHNLMETSNTTIKLFIELPDD